MGFLNKPTKTTAARLAPVMPMAPQSIQELRAGQIMPNSPKLDRRPSIRMPAPPARFDRATAPVLNPGNIGGNLGSDFRAPQMPQKRGGFRNLGEAIRRLKEQGGMGMKSDGIRSDPRRSSTPPRPTLQELFASKPGLLSRAPQKRGGLFAEAVRKLQKQLRIKNQQMPAETIVNLLRDEMGDMPMTQDLPEVESVGMMPPGMGDMQPRMMMAEGDEVFMPSNPNQLAFSIGVEINNLYKDYEEAVRGGDDQRAMMLNEEINDLEARRIKMMNEAKAMEGGRTISDMDRQQTGRTISDLGRGRTISDLDRGRTISDMDRQIGMMYGGEMKGYADGGEIEAMLGGMDSGEQEAMGELEQMAPEMEIIDQLVMMVAQMIQQGADEQQVISFLREQGLDDEDIGTVLQLVTEMAETEEMAEDQIGNELAQLG